MSDKLTPPDTSDGRMNDKLTSPITSNDSLKEQWAELQAQAPAKPDGIPSEEHLEQLKLHKAREKRFLSSLTTEQHALFAGRKAKRDRRLELERKRRSSLEKREPPPPLGLANVQHISMKPSTHQPLNPTAEALGTRLDSLPEYLTTDGSSWILLKKNYLKSPDPAAFDTQWNLHPTTFHKLKLFGRTVSEQRWSQSWGYSYAYSGSVNQAKPIEEDGSGMVCDLIDRANSLIAGIFPGTSPYNGCLQNWYGVRHQIGLHSDDERSLKTGFPIMSLTWGGTRRFLLKPRGDPSFEYRSGDREIYLEDGDLLVMGGTTQQTHKHAVPKHRTTRDPPTSNLINWTVRAFKET